MRNILIVVDSPTTRQMVTASLRALPDILLQRDPVIIPLRERPGSGVT